MGWSRVEAVRWRGERRRRSGAGEEPAADSSLWERALELERRRRRTTLEMLRAVERLNAASETEQVLEAVRVGVRNLLRGQTAVACWVGEPREHSSPGDWPTPLGNPLRLESWCFLARKMLWIENAGVLRGIDLPLLADGSRAAAAIAAPLFRIGRPCGVVAVYFDAPRLFTRSDRRTLVSFIGQAAAALQRVRQPAIGGLAKMPYSRPLPMGVVS